MATLSPPPGFMQTELPYRPQTQPSVSTMSQQRLTLPTPNTTAVDQTAPMPKKRHKFVWAVCIPCDGAIIHQKMFEIITDIDTGRHVPMMKNWWPEQDQKAKPMNLSLYALDPLPLGGKYLLFTIVDATRIPRNPHLGHRIHGDAYLFKVNQLQVHAGVQQPDLQRAIYEDVPGDLLTSPLLKEMTQAMEWKVFSPYNVVQLGRVRAQMREREMIEQREKEQRLSTQSEPARDSQLMQMDGDATESQERETERQRGKRRQNRSKEEKKREHEDTMRQHQRMIQMKDEQMKNDTRAWEQKNGNKRREGMDQEGREHAMDVQQHVSPSFRQTVPPNSPAPSPKRRQAVTPTSTPSRVRKSTLRSSVKKTPSSKSKGKKSAAHNITIESVEKHVAALSHIGASHDVPEASGAASQGVTPVEGTVSNTDPFAMSFEERNGFAPMELPAFDETAGWSFEQGNGFTPMEMPAFDETAGASFAEPQQGVLGFGGGVFDGLEDLFPGVGGGVGGGGEGGFN